MTKKEINNAQEKLDMPIKSWYISKYPSDELGKTLSPTVTFLDLNNILNSGKGDVYTLLGGYADTTIRERCFEKLCELTNQNSYDIYSKWIKYDNSQKDALNLLYRINLKEFKHNFEGSDFDGLDYIKDYITPDLEELYYEVLEYNEIYANGWTIKDLFKKGKKDKYWSDRAHNFIKKHHVPKKDYDEYIKYYDDYCVLRTKLLDALGLSEYLDSDVFIDEVPVHGFLNSETITKVKDIEIGNSYTLARVNNFGNCVELHYYSNGEAKVEYGYKYTHDYWENEIEDAEWFNLEMTDEEIQKKLYQLFKDKFDIKEKEQNREDLGIDYDR